MAKPHELNVSVLQIADNMPLEGLTLSERQELKERFDKYGIELECGTQGVRPERVIPFIEFAAFFGSRVLRTLIHDSSGCPTLEEAEGYIKQLLPHLHQNGIVLAVENHDFFRSMN